MNVNGSKLLAAVLALGILAPAAALAGGDSGLKKYKEHDFDKAIAECQTGKDVMSRLVLALSYTEKYQMYKNKADKASADMYLKPLMVDVTVADAVTIEKFLGVAGNPNGNKEASKLLKKSFDGAKNTPDDIMLMVKFLKPEKGVDVNNIALTAIAKRLDPTRDYVNKGGVMSKEMQEVMVRDDLIVPIIGALAEKKTQSGARKCLVLIEEPSLKFLEQQQMSTQISDAVVAVKKAIANRKKKYPNSTWFSAAGK